MKKGEVRVSTLDGYTMAKFGLHPLLAPIPPAIAGEKVHFTIEVEGKSYEEIFDALQEKAREQASKLDLKEVHGLTQHP